MMVLYNKYNDNDGIGFKTNSSNTASVVLPRILKNFQFTIICYTCIIQNKKIIFVNVFYIPV